MYSINLCKMMVCKNCEYYKKVRTIVRDGSEFAQYGLCTSPKQAQVYMLKDDVQLLTRCDGYCDYFKMGEDE